LRLLAAWFQAETMKMYRLLLLGLFVFALKQPILAETVNCSRSEHRQFDFWIGTWTVKDAKEQQTFGKDSIEKSLYGCAIEEHFRDTADGEGKSLSFFEPRDGLWHQTYLDNAGAVLQLSGGFKDDQMMLVGTVLFPGSSQSVMVRIVWKKIDGTRVRMYQENSSDAGSTWKLEYDAMYVKQN
jgi:hypothetical protein